MTVLNDLLTGLATGTVEVVDLTAPLSDRTPVLQLPPPFANTQGFSLTEISRYDASGPAWCWNDISTGEHVGTHFDAPVHWVTGRDGLDVSQVPAAQLIAPAVVLDLSAECAADPDFLLEIDRRLVRRQPLAARHLRRLRRTGCRRVARRRRSGARLRGVAHDLDHQERPPPGARRDRGAGGHRRRGAGRQSSGRPRGARGRRGDGPRPARRVGQPRARARRLARRAAAVADRRRPMERPALRRCRHRRPDRPADTVPAARRPAAGGADAGRRLRSFHGAGYRCTYGCPGSRVSCSPRASSPSAWGSRPRSARRWRYGAEVHHFGPAGHPVDLVQFPVVDLAAVARGAGLESAVVRRADDLRAVSAWLAAGARVPLLVHTLVVPTVVAAWLEDALRGH